MLALIEGVGVAINVYSYRQQQIMQEQQAEIERKHIEKMLRIQRGDAWHDDRETKQELLSLQDAAGVSGG